MNKNAKANRGPGRPMYQPIIPKGKFTMADFCEANGVNVKNGKGKMCSKLTLIKFMDRKIGKSMIRKVKGEFAAPANKKGLGRKAFLYERIPGATVPKSPVQKDQQASPKSPKTRKSTAPTSADYEATKSALLAPTPAVVITSPEPTVTEPEVAETPVETVAETADPVTA